MSDLSNVLFGGKSAEGNNDDKYQCVVDVNLLFVFDCFHAKHFFLYFTQRDRLFVNLIFRIVTSRRWRKFCQEKIERISVSVRDV